CGSSRSQSITTRGTNGVRSTGDRLVSGTAVKGALRRASSCTLRRGLVDCRTAGSCHHVDKPGERRRLHPGTGPLGHVTGRGAMASAARSVLNVRRVAVRLGALAIIVLALSASGAAADGITPSATSLNLAPGSSATI